jgi:hypothetical protein
MATLKTKLLLRNDTAANWKTSNPTLGKGEVGVEIDTYKLKIGDGSTAWNSLSYFGTNVVVEGEGSVIVDAVYENGVLTLTKGDIEVDVGVTSVKTTDDNVINLTPTTATAGAVTIDAKHATKGPGTTDTTKGATADLTINSTTTSGTIKIPKVTVDKYGHTTGLTEQTLSITIPTIPNISIVDKNKTDTTDLVYAVSNLVENGHTITPTYTGLPTKKYVDDKISAATNAAVILKGTLGEGGTITALPEANATTVGDAYKVVKEGTYAGIAAKSGDLYICYASGTNTYDWMHIPSGDDIEDTWRSVQLGNDVKLGSGTSTGALIFKNVDANAVTVSYDSGFTFDVKTGYTASGKNYAIKKDTNGNLYVNVPWSDSNGYGKITPANSTAVTALTGNTTQIVAASANENVKFSAANKWIVLAGTNSATAGSDELKFAHALSGVTADAYGPTADVTGNNNSTVVIPEITVDAAGHITTVTERTLTLKNTTYSVVTASANGLAPKMTANNAFLARVGSATNPTWNTLVALDGGSASTTTAEWGTITA